MNQDDIEGQVQRSESPLVTCLTSGMMAYAIVFIVALGIQIGLNYPEDSPYYRSGYHFVSCVLLTFVLVAWTMYDADLMHYKLAEEEWAHTIVFFWADLLMLFSLCCLICLCCLMGGNDGGAMDGGDGASDAAGQADFGGGEAVEVSGAGGVQMV